MPESTSQHHLDLFLKGVQTIIHSRNISCDILDCECTDAVLINNFYAFQTMRLHVKTIPKTVGCKRSYGLVKCILRLHNVSFPVTHTEFKTLLWFPLLYIQLSGLLYREYQGLTTQRTHERTWHSSCKFSKQNYFSEFVTISSLHTQRKRPT